MVDKHKMTTFSMTLQPVGWDEKSQERAKTMSQWNKTALFDGTSYDLRLLRASTRIA